MYPLLLKPVIKNYIWGGGRLVDEFGYEGDVPAAEAWCLTCREGDENVVLNGEYAGRKISDVPWVGEIKKEGFPLLIKLIDAARDLSVQVHPSRGCAARHPGDEEKTEMWYVVDCEDGASLIRGFNEDFDREKKEKKEKGSLSDVDAAALVLKEHIEREDVLSVCKRVPVSRGDVVFVEPGTLHAICRGILIAEIQQNSDTTYRVYDYGRLGADGRPRELHTERALDALTSEREALDTRDKTMREPYGKVREFSVGPVSSGVISLDGTVDKTSAAPLHLLALSGDARLSWKGGEAELHKGSSVLVPRGLPISLSGSAEILATPVR